MSLPSTSSQVPSRSRQRWWSLSLLGTRGMNCRAVEAGPRQEEGWEVWAVQSPVVEEPCWEERTQAANQSPL